MTGPGGARDDTHHVVSLWRLQASYADTITRRAWSELASLFRPDAVVVLDTVTAPVRTIIGPEALGAFVGPAIERFDHFTFVILNSVVDVTRLPEEDPDGVGLATGRIFMCEVRHDQETDDWPNAHGLYQDDYEFVDGRWWISGRRYRSLARAGAAGAVFPMPDGLRPFPR
jgi:hypothetical protein